MDGTSNRLNTSTKNFSYSVILYNVTTHTLFVTCYTICIRSRVPYHCASKSMFVVIIMHVILTKHMHRYQLKNNNLESIDSVVTQQY